MGWGFGRFLVKCYFFLAFAYSDAMLLKEAGAIVAGDVFFSFSRYFEQLQDGVRTLKGEELQRANTREPQQASEPPRKHQKTL